ncbi:MAG: bifunctional oligoribonuclease/PAP phosphatase NrnA [Longimicrobiales bacterium]|nr:bifunctional oligoribonuclease/PAP phosphatase NrnA [Longimicrobiales bacterium]
MSYRTPSHRTAAANQVKNALLASRRAVLTTHLNADGDGAGSQGALVSWMRANGTEAWIVNPTTFPDNFRFLVENEDWIVHGGSGKARRLCETADLAVVLDTGEVPRIGRVAEMIRELPTAVIDHHPPGDRPIGGTALRDATACATGELVYDVILAAHGPWSVGIAEALYVALLTDTGGFRFDNSTARCHRVVAELIEMGADPAALHERVYGAAPLRKYRLLRHALDTLQHDAEARVSWMIIPPEPYDELGITAEDLEGIVDIPRSIEGTEVGLLFRNTSAGEVKVSFRSNGDVDVNRLAREFDGGGHVKASGAVVAGPMDDAVTKVLGRVRDAVKASKNGDGSA